MTVIRLPGDAPQMIRLIAILLFFLSPLLVRGATIIQHSPGSNDLLGPAYIGQSFTIGSGTDYNNIAFSWLSRDGGSKIAVGNLFLLDQEYLGSPNGLSAATAGFVAESTSASGGSYLFDAAVTLEADTMYWAYMGSDSGVNGGGFTITPGPVVYTGGVYYEPVTFTNPATNYHSHSGQFDATFLLEGEAVPEPSRGLLLMLGVGLGAMRRRRG